MTFGSINESLTKQNIWGDITMKTENLKPTITFILTLLICLAGYSQKTKPYENPKYGPDSASRMECIKNFSLYREFVKQKNYTDAIDYWYKVLHSCPKASKNIYIDGVKIMRYFIRKEKDPVKKSDLVDTLMKVYDQRIKYYKGTGYVLGRKGVDYLRYRNTDIEDVEIGYNFLHESIKISKNKSEEAVMVTFMTATETLFKEAKITNEKVIENYAILLDIVDANLQKKSDDKKMLQARDNIDAIFERSGAATCEALVNLFKPKFEAKPEDIPLLEKITNLLDLTDCKEDDLFYNASEKLHNLKPTAGSAVMVAEMSKKRENFEKAIQYFKEAITLEEDGEKKALSYLQLADIYRKKESFETSREFAYKAIEANPSSGDPYILIGHLYAASKNCGTNELEKASIYWVAVDKYMKAKSVDPVLSEDANKYILTYSKYFPSKETTFFFSLKEGDPYKVNCWINESTTVRIK